MIHTQDFHEEVNCFEISQFIVVGIHAYAEEEAGVAPVDDFVVPEFDEVGLVALVAGRDEAVDFAAQADLEGRGEDGCGFEMGIGGS